MAMQTTSNNAEGEPMMEINTTPLIDVMLVLIIMLIITIPPQTHAVKLDLPQNNPNDAPPPIDPIKNKIVVTQAGQILWNGGRGRPGPVAPVPRRDAADRPGARASPPARARSALRAGRRSPRGDQEGQGHQDGVRRQRSLYEGLLDPSFRSRHEQGGPSRGRPFSVRHPPCRAGAAPRQWRSRLLAPRRLS